MSEHTSIETTSDERLMSAVAHFFGLLAALIIWALQKDKSKYVRFQAVQAIAFDFAMVVLSSIVSFCLMGVMFLGIAGSAFAIVNSPSPEDVSPLIIVMSSMFPFGIFICLFPYSLVLLLVRALAAGSVLAGRDFRYPVLGKWVRNFLRDSA